MNQVLVSLENAGLFIPGATQPVLSAINWQIRAGRHTLLLGANGSGKTSLLRLIHGDLWASSGRISWRDGESYSQSPIVARQLAELVSPLIQENWQRRAWNITVEELLAGFPAGITANSKGDALNIMAALDAEAWLDLPISALSQGQLRLALLAGALLRNPPLLLLDECLDGLDKRRRHLFLRLLGEYGGKTTMVFVTHQPGELPDWIVETLYLHDGGLHSLPPRSLETHPGIMASAPEIPEGEPAREEAKGELLLSLDNVSVYVERRLILKNITWNLRTGEHWRIGGENGAGKSTFLRLLAGDEFAAGGQLRRLVDGEPVETLEGWRRAAHMVSDLGQALYGYPLSGLELVCSGFDYSIGLYREISKEEEAWAREIIALFFPAKGEAELIAAASIRALSSGQLRRLHLARALVGRPRLLFLDEPCSLLDRQSRRTYLELLEKLAVYGLHGYFPGVVLVSHNEQDAPAFINRAAEIVNGRLVVTAG